MSNFLHLVIFSGLIVMSVVFDALSMVHYYSNLQIFKYLGIWHCDRELFCNNIYSQACVFLCSLI